MAYSPSVSSATLSLESIDDEIEITGTGDLTAHITDAPPTAHFFVDRLTDQDVLLENMFLRPGEDDRLSSSMLAAAQPDPRILSKILWSAHDIYREKARKNLAIRHENTGKKGLAAWIMDIATLEEEVERNRCEFGPDAVRVIRDGEVGITTPLMEAIRAQMPGNVDVLLKFNADPNGVPLEVMEHYAALFLRFRPAIPLRDNGAWDVASREDLLEHMDLPQTCTVTREEIEDRFWDGMAPFWCGQDFTPADFYHRGDSMPSLVEAARCGSTQIFDQLLEAGAEKSFWMGQRKRVPCHMPPFSSLSVSSPIHAAVQSNDMVMLKHLLSLGFDPNTLPLTNPTRCLTPLMATVAQQDLFNKTAFNILCACPNIKPSLKTPVYGVHLLHFAVASLDLDTIKYITTKIPLIDAGETWLGHNLLHVACMPANARAVQRHSPAIYCSIHETRDMHAQNDPHASLPPPVGLFSTDFFAADLVPHTEVVKYLWSSGIQGIDDEDCHGNTPLHYLVGCRNVNRVILTWWLEQEGVHKIWTKTKNRYGYTAQELFYSGNHVRMVLGEEIPKPWFDRQWARQRWVRKQAIWRNLLGGKEWRSV